MRAKIPLVYHLSVQNRFTLDTQKAPFADVSGLFSPLACHPCRASQNSPCLSLSVPNRVTLECIHKSNLSLTFVLLKSVFDLSYHKYKDIVLRAKELSLLHISLGSESSLWSHKVMSRSIHVVYGEICHSKVFFVVLCFYCKCLFAGWPRLNQKWSVMVHTKEVRKTWHVCIWCSVRVELLLFATAHLRKGDLS